MMRWWMTGRYNMLYNGSYYDAKYCAIVCPYCKDVHECPSVHDFCQHYADIHSDREGLLSVKLLQWRTWQWRDEHFKKEKEQVREFTYGTIFRNCWYRPEFSGDTDWLQ
jgi:hypothetical protein